MKAYLEGLKHGYCEAQCIRQHNQVTSPRSSTGNKTESFNFLTTVFHSKTAIKYVQRTGQTRTSSTVKLSPHRSGKCRKGIRGSEKGARIQHSRCESKYCSCRAQLHHSYLHCYRAEHPKSVYTTSSNLKWQITE